MVKMARSGGLVLCCVVWLCCLDNVVSENPGFQTRITTTGLNYANQQAIAQLSGSVKGQTINIPPGKAGSVSYSITDAVITDFSPPSSSSLIPVAGRGLKWSASNIGLKMSGHFKYSFRKHFIKFSDHGSFKISVSEVSFGVQADFGVDVNGRPSIKAGPCSSDIGSVSVKFEGKWAWAYNLFRGQVADKVKGLLKDKMCDLITRSINTDAEKSLSMLKITVGIGKELELSYQLTGPPKFTSDYMETYHKGEIYWKSAPAPPPFQAPPLPPWGDTSRMMYLWVSDFMMNSLFYQAQKHNFLSYNLTAKDLPVSARDVLNTTCTSSLCIGNFIPALQQKFPNCRVELRMTSTKTPQISVVNGSVETRMAGLISVYVRPEKTSSTLYFEPGVIENNQGTRMEINTCDISPATYIFTMTANMTLTGQISVVDQVMHYKVTNMTIPVSLKNSTIPNVNEKALNFLIKYAVGTFIRPSIEDLGKKGITLPLGKVTLKNAKLVLLKHAFVIATDLVYNPDMEY